MVRLLPVAALPVLPQCKQYFTAALAEQSASGCHAPRCVEAGAAEGDAPAVETDPAVLLVVLAVVRSRSASPGGAFVVDVEDHLVGAQARQQVQGGAEQGRAEPAAPAAGPGSP